jgi:hypothetical protein
MATTEPIMIYISDLEIIDPEVQRRAGFDITDRSHRKEVIQIRKEVVHDMLNSSKYVNNVPEI